MIGTRGHDVGCMSANELAKEMKAMGADSVQLVAYKAIEGLEGTPGQLALEQAQAIGEAFQNHGVGISLLGSYFNLLEEPSDLAKDMDRFKEYLEHAKAFGACLVGTETGSYKADWSYHPDNHTNEAFEKVVEIVKELVQVGQKNDVYVGIEGVYNHVIYSPQRMAELIKRIDSPYLKVIFDPVNYLHIGNYDQVEAITDQAIDLFGGKIALVHAKDFIIEDGQMKRVSIGKGLMNYPQLLNKLKQPVDIIVEELSGKELRESLAYLKEISD